MNSDPYLLSFTSASLSLRESLKIAETYMQLRNWDATEAKVKGENLLQARTRSSIRRVYLELAPRLQQLSDDQLELLVEGNPTEQKQLLWLAICRRYAFIAEFAQEVLQEKFLRLDYTLTDFDYEAFFNRKADWHPELDQLSETTRKKLKQVLLRMLREAGLLSADGIILPAILSARLVASLAKQAPMSYQIYPASVPEPK